MCSGAQHRPRTLWPVVQTKLQLPPGLAPGPSSSLSQDRPTWQPQPEKHSCAWGGDGTWPVNTLNSGAGGPETAPKSPRSRLTPSDALLPHRRPAAQRLSGPEGEPRLVPPAPPSTASHRRKKPSLEEGGPSPAISRRLTEPGDGGQKGAQKSANGGHQQSSGARPGRARGRNTPQQTARGLRGPGAACYPSRCPVTSPVSPESPDQPVSCTQRPSQLVRTGCHQRGSGSPATASA